MIKLSRDEKNIAWATLQIVKNINSGIFPSAVWKHRQFHIPNMKKTKKIIGKYEPKTERDWAIIFQFLDEELDFKYLKKFFTETSLGKELSEQFELEMN
tara:strand:+ start:651 stop:947 length:297 start_codon:yes stop_codon:yes gene_type:complete